MLSEQIEKALGPHKSSTANNNYSCVVLYVHYPHDSRIYDVNARVFTSTCEICQEVNFRNATFEQYFLICAWLQKVPYDQPDSVKCFSVATKSAKNFMGVIKI